MRTNVEDLEKTFPEEMFDVPLREKVETNDSELELEIDKDHEIPPPPSVPAVTPEDYVTSSQLVEMEGCIVFTDKILELLLTIHGTHCTMPNCGKVWKYQKTYVGNVGNVLQVIREEVGPQSQCSTDFEVETYCFHHAFFYLEIPSPK